MFETDAEPLRPRVRRRAAPPPPPETQPRRDSGSAGSRSAMRRRPASAAAAASGHGTARGAGAVAPRRRPRDGVASDPTTRTRGRHRSRAGRRHAVRRGASRARISSGRSRRAASAGRDALARVVRCRAARRTGTEEIKVIGLRRVIAKRMSEAKRNIPHFAYVEEVDVTELESLRRHLNGAGQRARRRLRTCRSWSRRWCACSRQFPQCNALLRCGAQRARAPPCGARRHRDADARRSQGAGRAARRGARLCGISPPRSAACRKPRAPTRRPARSSRARRSPSPASASSAASCRRRSSTRPSSRSSASTRPWSGPSCVGGAVAVRLMMNLSSSFDHRFVDGFDAAAMIQVAQGNARASRRPSSFRNRRT